MLQGEGALIIFTLLTQLAVGTWLVAISLRMLIAKLNKDSASQLTKPALLLVGPIMCVALVISMFHLGSPATAYGSLANFGTSWLSREIIFCGLFLFFWIISCVNFRKDHAGIALGWITAILGLLAVFSMASIYYSTPIQAWTSMNTYIVFFATTVILGFSATTTLVAMVAKRSSLNQDILKLLRQASLYTLLAVVIQLFSTVINFIHITGGLVPRNIPAGPLQGTFIFGLVIHGLLILAGGLIMVLFLHNLSKKKESIRFSLNAFYLTFVIFLIGELLGRYLFYASVVPIRIGI
jgi:anaerobic dimethyl sulfoxide reductase subunit C (anchor subunit)